MHFAHWLSGVAVRDVVTVPMRSIGHSARAAPAAIAAAVCVLATALADSGHMAAAQNRLEAEYVASLAGIPIGHGNWVIDIDNDQYAAAASGATTGQMRFFSGARGTSASQGTFNGIQALPTSFAETIDYDRTIDDVRMAMAGGNVKAYSVEPPPPPHPNRIPVSEADRHGVVDPLSAVFIRVAGNGDPVSPQACGRKVAVFDGRVRYDLRSEFRRIEMVRAEKGYQGPAVVCSVYFAPISGYVPDRPMIKYLVQLRDAEVWLAPISGTRVLVPFRFSMPTPLGTGVLQATRFVAIQQPPRPSISAK